MDLQQLLLSNPSNIPTIPKAMKAEEIGEKLDTAIAYSQKYLNDGYEQLAVFCCRWQSDDTGSDEDCKLFIDTMTKLCSDCSSCTHSIEEEEDIDDWMSECVSLRKKLDKKKRSLFIFYYAGHATKNSTSDSLTLTALSEEDTKNENTKRDFTLMKDSLLRAAKANPFMDVLMVMDCCCAAVGGRICGSHNRNWGG